MWSIDDLAGDGGDENDLLLQVERFVALSAGDIGGFGESDRDVEPLSGDSAGEVDWSEQVGLHDVHDFGCC